MKFINIKLIPTDIAVNPDKILLVQLHELADDICELLEDNYPEEVFRVSYTIEDENVTEESS